MTRSPLEVWKRFAIGSLVPVIAAMTLGAMPSTVEGVLDQLTSSDLGTRMEAISRLHGVGVPVARAMPALLGALRDGRGISDIRVDEMVTARAVLAVQEYGREAVPYLLPELHVRSENGEITGDCLTGFAVAALAAIGAGAIPGLIESLDIPARRSAAAWALGEIGPGAVAAVPDLTRQVRESRGSDRHRAIWALGRIGPGARTAEDALRSLVDDEDEETRVQVSDALKRIREH